MPSPSNEVIRFLSSLSRRDDRTQSRALTALTLLIAVGYTLLHFWQTETYGLPAGQMKNIHVGGALIITFLEFLEVTPRERRWLRSLLMASLIVSAVVLVYIHVEYDALVTNRPFLPNTLDVWIAIAFVLVVLYAALKEWGVVIAILGLVGLAYGYFGYLIPGDILFHSGIPFQQLVAYTSIPFFTGMFGGLTELSVGTIFMFMLFGAVLEVTGGVNFILQIAYAISGRSKAGPAQVAVIGSGLFGMVSGSSVANVVATGSFTIPLMKRYGFRPEFSGAVEAVASTGGQIEPPVMGLAAFLIVGLTGIPYSQVMIAAAFPALIYYLHLMVGVHIQAMKTELKAENLLAATEMKTLAGEKLTLRIIVTRYGHLFFGVFVLVYMLMQQMPAGIAAMYSALTLLALDAVKRLVEGRADLGAAAVQMMRGIVQSLEAGARSGAQVAIVIAAIGILVEVLAITGFAQKLSNGMLDMAGGNMVLLLLISALACLAFGLGLPTSISYLLVAMLGAPALRDMGVPLLAAHFFVLYFANIANITPPVAVAAMVAANIAGASYFKTGLIACRLGLPGFLLPFIFVVHPEILGIDASLFKAASVALGALIGIVAFNIAFEGYMFTKMAWWERLALLPVSFGVLHPDFTLSVIGSAIFVTIMAVQWKKKSRLGGRLSTA